jgi:FixJ family two-component response regulator
MSINAANVEPIIFTVADDVHALRAVAAAVQSFGWRVQSYESVRDFLDCVNDIAVDQTGCVVVERSASALGNLEVHRRVAERGLALPTIIVAAAPDTGWTVRALRAGVLAVLDAPYREAELRDFIEEALAKSQQDSRRRRRQLELERRFKRLSPPDRQVLQLILEGCKNRTMAKRLEVSLRTVENRRKKVFDVMQAESVAELTRMVMEYEHGLACPAGGRQTWMALPFDQVA